MLPTTEAEGLPRNRNAVISACAGGLATLSICIAVIPIPLTGYICFPAAAMLSLVAVVTGLRSLPEIRRTGGRGKGLALAGALLGGTNLAAGICLAVLLALFWAEIAEAVRGLLP